MGQHALIADPDPVRAALYAGILKQEGYYSVVVKDMSAATASLVERGPPALAVVDLAIGLDLIERLRRAAPAAVLPIIVVSALRTERDLATAHRVRLGLGAILAKAVSEESFRRVARRLLGLTPSDETEAPAPLAGATTPTSGPPTLLPASEPGARADSGVRRRNDAVADDERAARPAGRPGSRR